jgi:hypothetical protein
MTAFAARPCVRPARFAGPGRAGGDARTPSSPPHRPVYET